MTLPGLDIFKAFHLQNVKTERRLKIKCFSQDPCSPYWYHFCLSTQTRDSEITLDTFSALNGINEKLSQ